MSRARSRRLAGRPQHYDVGYGKPPTAHRFKKGQSGNPRGRPTGATARTPARPTERIPDIVLQEASRLITVHDGNRTMTLSMMQAAIRALVIRAVKGDPRALRFLIEIVTAIERETKLSETEAAARRMEIVIVDPLDDPAPAATCNRGRAALASLQLLTGRASVWGL